VSNCIIWGNSDPQVTSSVPQDFLHCCIEDWTGGGEGNISDNPLFVGNPLAAGAWTADATYDREAFQTTFVDADAKWQPGALAGVLIARAIDGCHLVIASNSATTITVWGDFSTWGARGNKYDIYDYRLQRGSPCIDVGRKQPWMMDAVDLDGRPRVLDGNADGEAAVDMGAYEQLAVPTWYVDGSVQASGNGTTWERAFKTIQEGVKASSHGDAVIVARGTYVENVRFEGKNITLSSENPMDWRVVEDTIIDGGGAGPVVTFLGTEEETCVLSGFTVRNGKAKCGGGILGGTDLQRTHATIEHNVIADNTAQNAGGLAYCAGLIRNNIVRGNWAPGPDYGDAGGFGWCDGVIQNNLVVGNSAERNAGGFYRCNGTIRNNTIVGNKAYFGALESCGGAIYNCIIWDGTPWGVFRNITYCCVQGGCSGEGNMGDDPLFVDADGPDGDPNTYEDNDYRLDSNSLCIGKGKNEKWMVNAVDLDGNPRIWPTDSSGIVDMGCYENGSFHFRIVRLEALSGAEGAELKWKGREGDTYAVESSSDLSAWAVEEVVASHGTQTSWKDSDTTSNKKCYRIGLK